MQPNKQTNEQKNKTRATTRNKQTKIALLFPCEARRAEGPPNKFVAWGSREDCLGGQISICLYSRGNKCHLMAKSFLWEKTEPTIFGIWPVGYPDMNPEAWIASSEIRKRAPFSKLFNVRTNLFCCFERWLTLNSGEKVDRLKIFIRTNYVAGWHLF